MCPSGSTSDGCCPLTWEVFGNECYFFSRTALSWEEARDWCSSHESHLVILTRDKEWVRTSSASRPLLTGSGLTLSLLQDFVVHHTSGSFFWVGLTDERTGKWEWVNQTPYVMDRR